MVSYSV